MRYVTVISKIGFTVLTFFGVKVSATSMASDITTILAPAGKFCLVGKMATIGFGFLTSQGIEKSLEVLSCFPKNSPQSRAYNLLSQLLYSREYGETISSLRGKNAGVVSYFNERLKTDEAFFSQSKAFYDELKIIDQQFYFRKHPELIGKIPSLAQASGQGAFSELAPGWLWTLAMKHSGQNPVTAIEVIGICGHDDVHYSPLTNGKGDSNFSCPMRGVTLFYTAQSLGTSVDLDQKTKNEIAVIQAPTMGIGALPSKSYHIYGGALFSCLMKTQGLPDNEIRAANSLIAKLYRGIDMRNRILVNKALAIDDQTKIEAELRDSCKTLRGRFLCPDFRTKSGYDQAREDRFVAGKLTEFDSYFLIDRWEMIKKIPIIGLPLDFDLNITATQAADRPQGWSANRFSSAMNRIRTYAVDRFWTEKQHIIGSDFALSQCGQ